MTKHLIYDNYQNKDAQIQKMICKNRNFWHNTPIMRTLRKNESSKLTFGCLKSGFSLVELLVVIAVLGVVAGLAIPSLAGVIEKGRSAKVVQQAQSVALTFSSARSAGAVFTNPSRESIVDALTRPGGVRGSGVFSDVSFSVPIPNGEVEELRSSPCLVEKTLPDGTLLLEFHPVY
jgi:hypothetical protein